MAKKHPWYIPRLAKQIPPEPPADPITYIENGLTITRYPARYADNALRQEDKIWHWNGEDLG